VDPLVLRQHLDLEERHWWFVARRKIVLDILDGHLPRGGDLEVLDAGCGGGATLESLRRYGYPQGMEPSEEAVAYNRQKGREVVRGYIEDMPFDDGSFDLVLALDVIEHVPEDLAALAELDRVLKPGGFLLVTVPALRLLWGPHDVANGHHRRYTLGGLRGRVEASGFEVVRATYFNTLLFPAILAARLLGRLRGKVAASDIGEVPRPLNAALEAVFSLEAPLLRRGSLPVGVSALCLARKSRLS
jgi:SAM-dependent methyltransferase